MDAFDRDRRMARAGLVLAILMVPLLATLPWWGDRGWLRLGVEMSCLLSLAVLWNLLAGYAGLVSVGQQAYVGIGGYTLFALTNLGGLSPLIGLVFAGVVALAVAVPTALLLFRLRGAYFAIGAWVMAEIFRLAVAQISPLGGGSGQSLPAAVIKAIASDKAARETLFFELGLGVAVVTIFATYSLLRSRFGLALTAIRDSEAAAASLGVDVRRVKLLVYVGAALITGVVGALLFLQKLRISPDAAFSVGDWTANVIFIVVIGGIGTIEGPILGTAVFFLLRETLGDLGAWYLILLGLLAIIVMLKAPRGLWGAIGERFGVHLFPVTRRAPVFPRSQGVKTH